MAHTELEREIWLRPDGATPEVAGAFVARAAADVRFDPAATEAFRVGTAAAIANALEHQSARSRGLLRVCIYLEEGCLTVELGNCGGFDPRRHVVTGSGGGLPLMLAAMDHVEIESASAGTTVRLSKRLQS